MSNLFYTEKKHYTQEEIRKELMETGAFETKVKQAPLMGQQDLGKDQLLNVRRDYLKRMIENSMDDNLRLRKKAQEQDAQNGAVAGGAFTAAIPERSSFTQKLPKAKGDKKWWQVWKKTEKNDVEDLAKKGGFKSADLCTLREYNAFNNFNTKEGGYKAAKLEGKDRDEYKKSYMNLVDRILKKKISAAQFTDEYLSGHIVDLYNYTRNAADLEAMNETDPLLYEELPYDRRLELKCRCEQAKEMKTVLEAHMFRHGIRIKKDGKVKLLRETGDKDQRRATLQDVDRKYNTKLEKFLMNLEYGQVVYQAETLTGLAKGDVAGNSFSGETELKQIDGIITSNPEAYRAYGGEMRLAYSEIKKAYSVRDGAIEELKGLLAEYRETNDPKMKETKKREMKSRTDTCALSASHIEHYRRFISFVAGNAEEIPADTAAFLKKEKQEEMTDLIDLKIMGNALQEAKGVRNRLNANIEMSERRLDELFEENGVLNDLVEDEDTFKKKYNEIQKNRRKDIVEKNNLSVNFLVLHRINTYDKAMKRIQVVNQLIAEEERKLEKIKEDNKIRTMTKEEFYALSDRYHAHREKTEVIKGYMEKARNRRNVEMTAKAKEYAAVNGVEYDRTPLSDMVFDPYGQSLGINWEWFFMAVSLRQKSEVKKEDEAKDRPGDKAKAELIEKGITPVLNKLLSLKADDIRDFASSKEPDLSKPETWEKYSLIKIGARMPFFLEILSRYGVVLSKEDEAKLSAFHGVAQKLAKRYDMILGENRSSMEALAMGEDVADIRDDLIKGALKGAEYKKDVSQDQYEWLEKYKAKGRRGTSRYTEVLRDAFANYRDYVNEWNGSQTDYAGMYEEELKKALGGTESKEEQKEQKEKTKQKAPAEQKEQAEQKLPAEEKKQEEEEILHVSSGVTLENYEKQTRNNCWCVAGAALYNAHTAQRRLLNNDENKVTQKDFRAFLPSDNEIKTFEQVKELVPDITKEQYDRSVANKKEFMGEGKETFGNIYEAADFFLKKDKNLAVRRMVIGLPNTETGQMGDQLYRRQKDAFVKEVSQALGSGNPVAVFDRASAHYTTITDMDGETLTLLDSDSHRSEKKLIDEVLYRYGSDHTIEITYLSKLRSPKEEMEDQPNLTYSEEEGYGIKENDLIDREANAENPMWVEGISVSRTDEANGLVRYSYLPLKRSFLDRRNKKG